MHPKHGYYIQIAFNSKHTYWLRVHSFIALNRPHQQQRLHLSQHNKKQHQQQRRINDAWRLMTKEQFPVDCELYAGCTPLTFNFPLCFNHHCTLTTVYHRYELLGSAYSMGSNFITIINSRNKPTQTFGFILAQDDNRYSLSFSELKKNHSRSITSFPSDEMQSIILFVSGF